MLYLAGVQQSAAKVAPLGREDVWESVGGCNLQQ